MATKYCKATDVYSLQELTSPMAIAQANLHVSDRGSKIINKCINMRTLFESIFMPDYTRAISDV